MPRNKYYYYSEEECRYIEVKRGYAAMIGKSIIVLGLAAVFAFAFVRFYGNTFIVETKQRQIEAELTRLSEKIAFLTTSLQTVHETGNKLRNAVNLPLQESEALAFGRGGNRMHWQTETPELISLNESLGMIEQLELQIEEQKNSYDEILSRYEENKRFFSALPAIKPVSGDKTSNFGMRLHPIYKIMKFHTGQDFSAPIGTEVFTTGDGVVEIAGTQDGYGKVVIVNHGFGYKTVYAHLSKILVKENTLVKRGQCVGLSGNSGLSESPHLHYEVIKNGEKVNPAQYFFDDMTPKAYNKAIIETIAAGIPDEDEGVKYGTKRLPDGKNIGH